MKTTGVADRWFTTCLFRRWARKMLQSLVSSQLYYAKQLARPNISPLTTTLMSNPFQAGHVDHILSNQAQGLSVRLCPLLGPAELPVWQRLRSATAALPCSPWHQSRHSNRQPKEQQAHQCQSIKHGRHGRLQQLCKQQARPHISHSTCTHCNKKQHTIFRHATAIFSKAQKTQQGE